MEQTETPILKQIEDALQNGELPEYFCLEPRSGALISWLPGAQDGVSVFHVADPLFSEEAEQAILSVLQTVSQGTYAEAYQAFLELGRKYGAYELTHVLPQCLFLLHENSFDLDALYRFSIKCLIEASDIDCIKISLEILSVFTEPEPRLKKIIRTLGIYEEFTFYVLLLMENWSDVNEEIFHLAKAVHGWGRIHALERLKPQTQEIRDWLLHEGAYNTIMMGYTIRQGFLDSGAAQRLKGTLTDEEFASIGQLLACLFDDDGPYGRAIDGLWADGIGHEAVLDFLTQAAGRSLSPDDFDVIRVIRAYCDVQEEERGSDFLPDPDPEVSAACDRLLSAEA